MSPIEIQEITSRTNAMTEEEQLLVANLLPMPILMCALHEKYKKMENELHEAYELLENKNRQIEKATHSTRVLTDVLKEICAK